MSNARRLDIVDHNFTHPPRLQPRVATSDVMAVGERIVRLRYCRNHRARRYVLRVRPDGSARVTIPRGGSRSIARDFVQDHLPWVEKQLIKLAAQTPEGRSWGPGSLIWFRGEKIPLTVRALVTAGSTAAGTAEPVSATQLSAAGIIEFGGLMITAVNLAADLRPAVEDHLRCLAQSELVSRTFELARSHSIAINRVVVRDQRSRWGSCSVRGTVSLNWRLVQTPILVRDYLIVHELMHTREMNHSQRYWRCVEEAFPLYRMAEQWLRKYGRQLR